MWVLLIMVVGFSNGGPAVTVTEFYSEKSCKIAEAKIETFYNESHYIEMVDAVCIYDDTEPVNREIEKVKQFIKGSK